MRLAIGWGFTDSRATLATSSHGERRNIGRVGMFSLLLARSCLSFPFPLPPDHMASAMAMMAMGSPARKNMTPDVLCANSLTFGGMKDKLLASETNDNDQP
jgi:hypothetical protein